MNEKISTYIDKIRSSAAESNQKLQPPASDQQIADLSKKAEEYFGEKLPGEYFDLLRQANGLLWDNLYIYASETSPHAVEADYMVEGILDSNAECRETFEPYNDLIVFGYSGNLDYYVKEVSSGEFQILDKGSLSVNKSFKTFDELLVEVLKFNLE